MAITSIGRILAGLAMIIFVGAIVVGATGAFFSDTETSTGNTFSAGAIDLRIDNESYAIDCNIPGFQGCQGVLVANAANSWELVDLTIQKFFDFVDLKPGDIGEDTISVHVGSNDAWLCAAAQITDDHDNTYTEPEEGDDSTVNLGDPTNTDGELDEGIEFAFWEDDGDNVLEDDETSGIFISGPLSGLGEAGQIALADSEGGVIGEGGPVPGNTEFFIGKAWCFGNLTPAPVAEGENSPLTNTGFTCDGSLVDNAAQTDMVVGDLEFYAEQSRNNDEFTCEDDYTPSWTPAPPPAPPQDP